MYSVFAVDPESIDSWESLRYIVEKFGYSRGLLIARYPKRWKKMVMEACLANGVGEYELKHIEEKLSLIKNDRLYRMGLPYAEPSWIDNVSQPEVLKCFDAVLIKGARAGGKFHDVISVDEELFEGQREMRVKRTALNLATVAKRLLSEVATVVLVDPYFRPEPKCLKVLCELVTASKARGKGVTQVVIYVALSKSPEPKDALEGLYRESLADLISGGLKLSICRVKDKEIDFDFHARYLLTEKGGLRYDRGFIEPNDRSQRNHKTDVTCMDNQLVAELRDHYRDDLTGILSIDSLQIA
ncbi:hypothetical protein [Halioglobus sp. Uisw_031]|uniref:hypothetical protein n=1 Tax=Halioglobus sp. Uisw_031 TaxID=3230977 RepID=UPI0039E88FF6